MGVSVINTGGRGWDPLGTLATIGGLVTGQPWIGAAYNAGKSAINGDWNGALVNGAKAAIGGGALGKTGAAAGAATGTATTPAIESQLEADPSYIQKGLSALNAGNNAGNIGFGLGAVKAADNSMIKALTSAGNQQAVTPAVDQNRWGELMAQYGLSDMDWTTRQQRGANNGYNMSDADKNRYTNLLLKYGLI